MPHNHTTIAQLSFFLPQTVRKYRQLFLNFFLHFLRFRLSVMKKTNCQPCLHCSARLTGLLTSWKAFNLVLLAQCYRSRHNNCEHSAVALHITQWLLRSWFFTSSCWATTTRRHEILKSSPGMTQSDWLEMTERFLIFTPKQNWMGARLCFRIRLPQHLMPSFKTYCTQIFIC